MKVNMLDLSKQYATIEKEVLREIAKVCKSQWFVLGKHVKGLEEEIAKYTGAKYAIGVSSGSDAITIALMALGIGKGDEVITTPYTFFSTAGSIALVGAKAVFVDIDPVTYNIDVDAIEGALERDKKRRRIKAIMPVHLYGQAADMTKINALARKYGVKVIEDAAQAIGATYKSKGAGSLGTIGCFSFYPTKNLGGFGDAGMVTTNNKALAKKLSMLRVHGSSRRYYHDLVGMNGRLDEIQAVVLRIKLKKLDKWSRARKKNARLYEKLFKAEGLLDMIAPPVEDSECGHVYNQYVIRAKKRDALKDYLAKNGVGSDIYYPVPLHLQACFKDWGYKRGSFPVSEKAARETLALPIYPELTVKEIEYVVATVKKFYS